MLNQLQLFRNIGQFDAVASNLRLSRLTLVYAENGRGKTTLAAVLRSLGSGDPLAIAERRRLGAAHPPHVVLDCTGGPPPAIFQNGAWNRSFPDVAVFDDHFVDTNVCSGLAVAPGHRQNLHELILGSQGVALNRALQEQIARIEAHNAALRAKADAIPALARGQLSVDAFSALPDRPDFDRAIEAAERALAAARQQDAVRGRRAFDPLTLPGFDVAAIEQVLAAGLPELDAAAAARVQEHLESIGRNGEAWVADGMGRIRREGDPCPFCAQDLGHSPVIGHYRTYFGEAYGGLKQQVATTLAEVSRQHGADSFTGFERQVRVLVEARQFWSQFCEVPHVTLDTAAVAAARRRALDEVEAALRAKQAAPLEPLELSAEARAAIEAYEAAREAAAGVDRNLREANRAIALVKEQAAVANVAALTADHASLVAAKARHGAAIVSLCADYLAEKAAKAASEEARDAARTALETYRQGVFPSYQDAINTYLGRFNAGFRLGRVASSNTRAGSSCTYDVLINNAAIPIGGGDAAAGQPSFRTALSAGDRNTLGLAFFFASLDQDPRLADKIVVIDDPISSLDEHRALATVNEIRRLAQRAGQVIVLSHNKPFLCRLWEGADTTARAALAVVRDGTGSTISVWDVHADCISEHDRRNRLFREYLETATANAREVATSLRFHLEGFLRVACPEHFPPGTLLGRFRDVCQQRVGSAGQILDAADIEELRELTEYANLFHHETNAAYQTAHINDGELNNFVRRTLAFTRR